MHIASALRTLVVSTYNKLDVALHRLIQNRCRICLGRAERRGVTAIVVCIYRIYVCTCETRANHVRETENAEAKDTNSDIYT